jgi:hypothetical protein
MLLLLNMAPHTIASRPELRRMSASFALNAVVSQCLHAEHVARQHQLPWVANVRFEYACSLQEQVNYVMISLCCLASNKWRLLSCDSNLLLLDLLSLLMLLLQPTKVT